MGDGTRFAETRVRLEVHGVDYVLDLPASEQDHVQSQIHRRLRPYEEDLLEHMKTLLRTGDVVVDAGAYIGNHTVYLSRVCGARVVAFEPNPEAFRVLRRNVELNELAGAVATYPIALGAARERGTLVTPSRSNLGDTRISKDGAGVLEIIPLDELELPRPVAAMKVDVQGMEIDVLRGARETVLRDRPFLYVETHTVAALSEIAMLLHDWGYLSRAQFATTPTLLFVPEGKRPYDTSLQIAMAQHRILDNISSQGARIAGVVRESVGERSPATAVEVHFRALDEKIERVRAEVALVKQHLDHAAEQTAADRVARANETARIERAIQTVSAALLDGQEVVRRLAAQELAMKRIQAELFSLRGRLKVREHSVLDATRGGRSPEGRRRSVASPPLGAPLDTWLRKLRKLRSTPRKFLTDSSSPWLRTSGRLLERIHHGRLKK